MKKQTLVHLYFGVQMTKAKWADASLIYRDNGQPINTKNQRTIEKKPSHQSLFVSNFMKIIGPFDHLTIWPYNSFNRRTEMKSHLSWDALVRLYLPALAIEGTQNWLSDSRI